MGIALQEFEGVGLQIGQIDTAEIEHVPEVLHLAAGDNGQHTHLLEALALVEQRGKIQRGRHQWTGQEPLRHQRDACRDWHRSWIGRAAVDQASALWRWPRPWPAWRPFWAKASPAQNIRQQSARTAMQIRNVSSSKVARRNALRRVRQDAHPCTSAGAPASWPSIRQATCVVEAAQSVIVFAARRYGAIVSS